ncbi:hypothetical protein HS1genome_1857 [Sulfodiicoccus acidiphilus]|uniref:Methyltransferase type 11 n=1 Tax=Sulfodiicoccus acidiphilus TaxID=1670455 RepID=A0A348B5L6_9CREN|nr:methyltransferase domain-containing protein [Sulfodiicoccus acidiphilus]BBD73468.1 hypothetical protein HS1genome_1857 [Sulfodiicoccus acidiphilus]GGT92908.1 hypothetical protein GCM10007116_08400 [Sulfodiicoccus acidiphilus]
MCNVSVIEFFVNHIECEEFRGKKVIEVGSRYVNGSVRPLIEKFCQPEEYTGVDIERGELVDVVLPAEKLVERFGENSFDALVSTEMLEHVKNWRVVVNNMKAVVKPLGYIYITTRSLGFPYHAFPYDFWRYEVEDLKEIFDDFNVISIAKDPSEPGVFLKARKPIDFKAKDLSDVTLYSMVLGKRTRDVPDRFPVLRYYRVKTSSFILRAASSLYRKIIFTGK